MGYRIDQRIVLVIRKTRQQELTDKYGTLGQAKFYVSRSRAQVAGSRAAGGRVLAQAPAAQQREIMAVIAQAETQGVAAAMSELKAVEEQSRSYDQIVSELRQTLDFDIPVQVVDRSHVPKMVFGPKDIIVAVGQDGIVANVAKYALGLPIIGVNPDPKQYDGVLLPFEWRHARGAVQRALEGRAKIREVTLAAASLNDGQRLLAFNDLFIGARSHVSARYRLESPMGEERQSSSGIIVSTGAGSTGWLSSILNMARGVCALPDPHTGRRHAPGNAQVHRQRGATGTRGIANQALPNQALANQTSVQGISQNARPAPPADFNLSWEDRSLAYVVREPFASKSSSASIIAGILDQQESLTIESLMGAEGTIFSDGVESDFLPFPEGVIASISVAQETARLVVG